MQIRVAIFIIPQNSARGCDGSWTREIFIAYIRIASPSGNNLWHGINMRDINHNAHIKCFACINISHAFEDISREYRAFGLRTCLTIEDVMLFGNFIITHLSMNCEKLRPNYEEIYGQARCSRVFFYLINKKNYFYLICINLWALIIFHSVRVSQVYFSLWYINLLIACTDKPHVLVYIDCLICIGMMYHSN